MRRFHRASAIAAMLALALVLASCGRGGDDGGGGGDAGGEGGTGTADTGDTGGEAAEGTGRAAEPITIGWTPPDITGVFQTATQFFEDAAAQANEAGFDVTVESRSPATHTDFADQLAIIDDYISTNVDAIVISPADTEAVKPAIQRANEAGIPVIVVNLLEEQSDIEVASYIGFDNTEAAKVSAYSVLDWLGGPGVLGAGEQVDVDPDTYLDRAWWEELYAGVDPGSIEGSGSIIEGIAGTFFSQARLDGFNEVVGGFPGVEIQGEPIPGDWNREQGIEATETFLSRFQPGEELQFIWAASNEMGLGAILTAERQGVLGTTADAGPAEGSVHVFTNDVTPESVDNIKQGRLIAETHHGFAEWGWFGAQFAVQIACGQEVPQRQDIRPRTVYEGNADQFYPDIALPEIDWDAIREDCG